MSSPETVAVSVLATGLGSPEGPDVFEDGTVVFVETFCSRVSTWDPIAGVQQYAYVGGAPNASLIGSDGVYITQTGATAGPWRSPDPVPPSIQRIDADRSVETVTAEAGGEPLLGPNDLCFGSDGRLYFTDSGIFDASAPEPGRICAIDPDGTAHVLVEVGPAYPNGIVVEPDGSVVWNESFTRRVRRRRPDGSIELLFTAPETTVLDGMKASVGGELYVTGVTSGGIDVLAADGTHIRFLATGGQPLNCVFTDTGMFVTDYGLAEETGSEVEPHAGRLLRVEVEATGRTLPRGAIAAAH